MRLTYKSLDELPLALKADDIADILGISRARAYLLVKSENFPIIKIGRRYIIPRDKFIVWMDINCKGMS